MNAERLLELYDNISEAPDAVDRLRRFVLDLAVRGKLVEQDPADEPASDLLAKIASQKAGLVERGILKTERASKKAPVPVELFDLPRGWTWSTLQALCLTVTDGDHQPPPKAEEGVPFLVIGDVRTKTINYDVERKVSKEYFDGLDPMRKPRTGDLLYTLVGSFGIPVPVLSEKPFCVQRHIGILRPAEQMNLSALALFMESEFAFAQAETAATGIAQKTVSLAGLRAMILPVPPLAEQHRIVAKVDELMGLCDGLEEARKEREATRDRLTTASLARLTAPETTEEDFPAHAAFALNALPALTIRPDQIKSLRQTILNLAVRGKLVQQDPADEPVPTLFERMAHERKALVATRKIRGATPPKAPLSEDEGYDLPSCWQLCALGQITLITDPNPSHRYPDYTSGSVPILSTREFYGEGGWNPETAKLTTEAFWEFQKEICDFAPGDIMFARKGRLGLPRFLPDIERYTFSHTLFSIKPMTGLLPEYLLWLLRRDEVVDWLTNEMNQNTGVPTLGKAKTERLPVPLPPLAEQHRIVAKVDELMALCDQLEAALTKTDTTRTRLLEALLHEALEPVSEDKEAAE